MARYHRMVRLTWAAALLALAIGAQAQDALERGFRNPPASARPHTWWHWVNDNISREGITADLEAMKRAGIGGAQMFHVDCGLPAGPVPYMSEKWRAMVQHAVKEAGRLGIELCIHNCSGWSSSGGPWITPEHGQQVLVWTLAMARGPGRVSVPLAQPRTHLGHYRDIVVLAFPSPSADAPTIGGIPQKAGFDRADRLQPDTAATPPGAAVPREGVLDLSGKMDSAGRLTWDAPEGEWRILRIGHTAQGKDNHPATPEGRGLECDKLSREAMDVHWNGMMAKVLADLGPRAGRALNNALIDSYEVGCGNWTPKMRAEFQRRRGYDPLPWLPVVAGTVVGSVEQSERFLWDLRRTIADLYADNYFGYFGALCRKNGLKFSTEPYGNGGFDNLQVGGLADIPMGEFWVGGGAGETTKLAAAAAHTNGRTVVGAESFTADDRRGRWLVDPYSIKALGDQVFCNGVNRYIFHRYAHQPWMGLVPGLTMGPWGMHLERTVTWWNEASAWLRYVARCQYLLQSGKFAADVCYYYSEDAPNDLPGRGGLRPALPAGYDYDGCDASVLMRRMAVKDGRIVLPDGMRYRVLVLPESRFMTPAVARKVRDLVLAGATVVGPRPEQSPSLTGYPTCDDEVRSVAAEVWGDCDGKTVTRHSFGKGRVVWGEPLEKVLAGMGAKPDFETTGSSRFARLAWIHRRVGNAELYFVSNQRYIPDTVEGVFRVRGMVPELWHPDTGKTEVAPVWREQAGRTVVQLRFDPAGSVFVVFRRPARGADHLASLARTGPAVKRPALPRLEVQRAFYEPTDGRPGADVTEKVRALVRDGQYAIPATNEAFGDPTPLVVKQLRVEYVLNGRALRKVVGENETLDLAEEQNDAGMPDWTVTASGGAAVLTPWQPGVYAARTASGRAVTARVTGAPLIRTPAGPWTVRFQSNRGAPERATFEKLLSWTDHAEPGIRYFSGTAEYMTTLDVPAAMLGRGRAVWLDLGRVKNFATVSVNGRSLGVLWKAPFRVDVTGLLKPGRNALAVKVTNLWPNRLIGDEQLPAEVEWNGDAIRAWPDWLKEGRPRPPSERVTFTTWRFYRADSPLLESGLLGPVTLRSTQPVTLR